MPWEFWVLIQYRMNNSKFKVGIIRNLLNEIQHTFNSLPDLNLTDFFFRLRCINFQTIRGRGALTRLTFNVPQAIQPRIQIHFININVQIRNFDPIET